MKCYNHTEAEAVGACTECGKMICKDCMLEINGKTICKSCVEKRVATNQNAPANNVNKKEMVASLILSLIVPGLGQIYNGQIKKGLTMLVGYYSLLFTAIILSLSVIGVCIGVCLLLFLIVFHIYNVYDAVTTVEKINSGEYVRDWYE